MKVGDLVTVAPLHEDIYLLVSVEAHDAGFSLPDCVMLLHPSGGALPMDKEFVEVVSESR
jgi:hypothetical protein